MSNGAASVAASVVNPFDVHGASWPTQRYYYGARPFPAEVQGPEEGTLSAGKYCAQSSTTGFQEIFNSPELFTTVTRMGALDEEEPEEDRPSKFASLAAVSILKQAAQFLERQFPRGSASVGANQGLRVTWRLPKGEVRLIVDGAKASKTYLYVELAAGDSFVEYAISGEKLAHAIWQALG